MKSTESKEEYLEAMKKKGIECTEIIITPGVSCIYRYELPGPRPSPKPKKVKP